MTFDRDPASFRDSAGFVFSLGDRLLRLVSPSFGDDYDRLNESGLYTELTELGHLVPHREVAVSSPELPPAHRVLEPRRIPFWSYPYEWSFHQLRDAALLTLEIQRRALTRGLTLRDASAFNIQFLDGRPMLIDTLSLGRLDEERPWGGYRQFCQHFVAPLALGATRGAAAGRLVGFGGQGLSLELGSRLVPRKTWLRPGLLLHLHLHARSAASASGERSSPATRPPRRMGLGAHLALVDSLRRCLESLRPPVPEGAWASYYGNTNYNDLAWRSKQEIVGEMLARLRLDATLDLVFDLGANTGEFSSIAARVAGRVVAVDADPEVTDRHYLDCRASGVRSVLPLCVDLLEPSPRCGWGLKERRSLVDRGPADLGLALALVHHLAIGANVPLPLVFEAFGSLCQRLLVEYVQRDDSQVIRMLDLRRGQFADYCEDAFVAAMSRHFVVTERVPIPGSHRVLFLGTSRHGSTCRR